MTFDNIDAIIGKVVKAQATTILQQEIREQVNRSVREKAKNTVRKLRPTINKRIDEALTKIANSLIADYVEQATRNIAIRKPSRRY